MINLSHPASEVMETDYPVLTFSDTIAHARQVVTISSFRAACVVTADGSLAGILTRTTLLDDVRRSVILLDHNEASQAVDGIEEADVVEIIDHHRLGAITTLKPIRFCNDPVGATSTIIAMKFMESGLIPSRPVAGALLSGILSDTLSLKMSTTTHRDSQAVKYLAPLAGENSRPAWHCTARTGNGSLRNSPRKDPEPRLQGVYSLREKSHDLPGDGSVFCLERGAE